MRRYSIFVLPALLTAWGASACSASDGSTDLTDATAGSVGSAGTSSNATGGTGAAAVGGNTGTAAGGNSGGGLGGQGNPGGGLGGQGNPGGSGNAGSGNAGSGNSSGAGGAGTGGTTGGAGTGSAGMGAGGTGNAGTGSVGPSEPSGMPIPSTNGVAKPAGTPGNLSVLNWAGFKAAVTFTFDDALSSQIANYATLQGTGVHFTFYLVSNNNGTSATWSQAAKDGHELGNHTAHHCHDDGSQCAWGTYAGSLGAELDQCTMHIEQQFGVSDVWTAAAPYGDAGYDTPDSTRFLLNRSVQGGQVGANDGTSPFALPCHTAQPSEVASTFNTATDSARTGGKWQIFLVHSLGGDGGYNPISVTELVSAINHAKTVGDTWADSMVHVGAYWRAQKLVTGVTPTTSGSSKTWTWTLPAHFPPGRYLRVKVDGGTLTQNGTTLPWSTHGYYEVALDPGSVTLSP